MTAIRERPVALTLWEVGVPVAIGAAFGAAGLAVRAAAPWICCVCLAGAWIALGQARARARA